MSDDTKQERSTIRRPPNAGKGRKPGSKNKMSASVQAALTEAFENGGGVPFLTEWMRKEPTEFFKLWAKMLPKNIKAEHTGADGGPIQQVIKIGDKVIAF